MADPDEDCLVIVSLPKRSNTQQEAHTQGKLKKVVTISDPLFDVHVKLLTF